MGETFIQFVDTTPWWKYFYGSLIALTLWMALKKSIDTTDIIRLLGLGATFVGAVIALSGQPNVTVWFGLTVVLFTYINDLIAFCKKKQPKYDRRSKP